MAQSPVVSQNYGNGQPDFIFPATVAFIRHSVETVENNLPPEIDNKSLARQLTHKADVQTQRVLEKEFEKNHKPDKFSRRAIVSNIALSDKEAQTWFQNRKQQARRIASQNHSEVFILSSDSIDVSESLSSPSPEATHDKAPLKTSRQSPSGLQFHDPPSQITSSSDDDVSSITTQSRLPASNQINLHTQAIAFSSSLLTPEAMSSSASFKVGYISNRRISSYVEEPLRQPRPLSSFSPTHDLRISMTPDGMAKIVNRAISSPSPEKPHSSIVKAAIVSHLGSLRRSHSAAGLDTQAQSLKDESSSPRKFARTSTWGRSRDSRTWEFWCDSDARNSLIERAAQESSGSAAEAICLMRSNSSRVLRLNANKVNSSMIVSTAAKASRNSKDSKRLKGSKADGKKQLKQLSPSLQRSSMHASVVIVSTAQDMQPTKKSVKTGEQEDEFEHFHTESDKENWEPNDHSSRQENQGAIVQSKKTLGENTTIMSQSSSFGAMMSQPCRSRTSKKRQEPDIRPDTKAGGTTNDSGASDGDDLDCVQSLLSLSQGNWS